MDSFTWYLDSHGRRVVRREGNHIIANGEPLYCVVNEHWYPKNSPFPEFFCEGTVIKTMGGKAAFFQDERS